MTITEYIHTNPRIFGAFLIGLAFVGGAYVMSNFSQPTTPTMPATVAATAGRIERSYIPVIDADGNGIEDWREEFVLQESIILPTVTEEIAYEAPTTLTGQISQQFFESVLRTRISGGIGPTEQDVVARTADTVARLAVNDGLYNTHNVTVIPDSNQAIRDYANAMGRSISANDLNNYENEITIMQRAMQYEDKTEIARLIPHTSMYKALRDEAVVIPVPQSLLKEHLDIINTYHALYKNLSDMQLAFDDPMLALMRIKRYKDDATGLGNALVNMFNALTPYAGLFTADDPAVVFVAFAPNFQ